jgi:RND family efflux transporter MFP subunit
MSIVPAHIALAAMLILRCVAVHAATSNPSTIASNASVAGTVTVHAQPVAQAFPAYGEVQLITPLPLSAAEPGIVSQMRVVPGSAVKAGDALAKLTGPEIQSLLISRQGAYRSTRTQLAAAERSLAIARRQFSVQLSTRQAVAAAESAVAGAKGAFDTAQSERTVAQELRTLRAPSAGTVLAVNAAEGERVMAGQTVFTLQTTNRLWLAAAYYGVDAAAIRVGMGGHFQPASGGPSVPVKVAAVSAALAPDGGASVGLVATDRHVPHGRRPPAPWLNGERGTVTLTGPTEQLVAVPTRALILDQARWWVLVQTSQGIRQQAVVPGPTRGWETFIEQGLSPGQQIVVENAYLEFHRGISLRYTPPD